MTTNDLRDPNRREQMANAVLEILHAEPGTHATRGIAPRSGPVGRNAGHWNFETQLRHTIRVTRSEVDHAACHSELEVRIARVLDNHADVAAFTRNHGPDRWEIPYRINDRWARYVPDFVARSRAGGEDACRLLVIEAKGRPDAASEAKARWTEDAFLSAANAWEREEGRRRTWRFVQIEPRDDVRKVLTKALTQGAEQHAA